MTSTAVESYCRKLYQRVYVFWQSRKGQYPTWNCGYRILYTPPAHRPPLMITGFQPGGDHLHVSKEQLHHWPAGNDYLDQHWRLAKRLQRIFGDVGKLDLIHASVAANVVFFRAPDMSAWNRNPTPVRLELEKFSLDEFIKLVTLFEPHTVLALGLKTFTLLDKSKEDYLRNKDGRTLIRLGRCRDTPLIALSQERALSHEDLVAGLEAGLHAVRL